jgi:hypothetical protein
LEVEEEKRVLLLGGEGRSKSKKLESPPREDPCSPFYQTRGAGYINAVGPGEREREREVKSAFSTGVREESLLLMQQVPPPLVHVVHMMTCMLSHARRPDNECF